MDHYVFKHILENVLYSLKKIMVANDNHNYDYIDAVVRQEIKAIKEDLKDFEGDKK